MTSHLHACVMMELSDHIFVQTDTIFHHGPANTMSDDVMNYLPTNQPTNERTKVTSLFRFVKRMSYRTMAMYDHCQSLYHSKTYIPLVLVSDDFLIKLKYRIRRECRDHNSLHTNSSRRHQKKEKDEEKKEEEGGESAETEEEGEFEENKTVPGDTFEQRDMILHSPLTSLPLRYRSSPSICVCVYIYFCVYVSTCACVCVCC